MLSGSPVKTRVLVVDDEESVRELLVYELGHDGYEVMVASDGAEALECLAQNDCDLVVLDIMLPDIDGIEVLRCIRASSMVPVIMLTAKSDEVDKVLGLELGADDYVTKDLLSIREFRSRIHAQLRRAAENQQSGASSTVVHRIGQLEIDPLRRSVAVSGTSVRLTFAEFEILKTLCTNPGIVCSREMLLRTLWGSSDYRDERTIDTHIRHLREKIEPRPSDPEYIFTVRNVGYTFREA